MKYDIVLFDADDTLFDFKRAERTAFSNSLIKNDIQLKNEYIEIYSKINISLWKKLEKHEITREKLKTERFERFLSAINCSVDSKTLSECYMRELSECGFLKDNAIEICEYLSDKCRLFIATNGLTAIQTRRFYLSGLDKYIEKMFISEKIGYQKPDKEFFDYIFDFLGINDKSRVIIVGDSITSDIQGGINAGIDTCLLDENDSFSDFCLSTYKIKSLPELRNLF